MHAYNQMKQTFLFHFPSPGRLQGLESVASCPAGRRIAADVSAAFQRLKPNSITLAGSEPAPN